MQEIETTDQSFFQDESFFPLKIHVWDKVEYECVAKTPKDLPVGLSFKVLETNYHAQG